MATRSKRNKYENYCSHIVSHFTVVSTRTEFYETGEFHFVCNRAGHPCKMKITSFGNKICNVKDLDAWCDKCNRVERQCNMTKMFREEIEEKLGHQIQTVDWSTRKVTYTCITCGETRQSCVQNLSKETSTSTCQKCQNIVNRLEFDEVQKTCEANGKVLLTKPSEYTTNKQKLDLLCECGASYAARLQDIRKGKSCIQCKLKKYEETCQRMYGVRNVSQLPEVMEKITKSGYTSKDYTLPSGRVVRVQGWEP